MGGPLQIAAVSFDQAVISDTITRAANTTQYTANDAISASDDTHFVFEVGTRGSLSGVILTATLFSSANQSTKLDTELFLFRSTITDMEDNVAFDPSDAELKTCIGVIKFNSGDWIQGDDTSGAGGNAMCQGDMGGPSPIQRVDLPFTADWDYTNELAKIYGQLKAKNTYTPVSAEELTVALEIIRNPA